MYTNWGLYVVVGSRDLTVWALGTPVPQLWDPDEEEGMAFLDFGDGSALSDDDAPGCSSGMEQCKEGDINKEANAEALVVPGLAGFLANDVAGRAALFFGSTHDVGTLGHSELAKRTPNYVSNPTSF